MASDLFDDIELPHDIRAHYLAELAAIERPCCVRDCPHLEVCPDHGTRAADRGERWYEGVGA